MKRDHLLYGGAAAFAVSLATMYFGSQAPEALRGVLMLGGLGLFVLSFVAIAAYRIIKLVQRVRDLTRK